MNKIITVFAGDDIIPVPYTLKHKNSLAYNAIQDAALVNLEVAITQKLAELGHDVEMGSVRVVRADSLKTVVFSDCPVKSVNSAVARVVGKMVEMGDRARQTSHPMLAIISGQGLLH